MVCLECKASVVLLARNSETFCDNVVEGGNLVPRIVYSPAESPARYYPGFRLPDHKFDGPSLAWLEGFDSWPVARALARFLKLALDRTKGMTYRVGTAPVFLVILLRRIIVPVVFLVLRGCSVPVVVLGVPDVECRRSSPAYRHLFLAGGQPSACLACAMGGRGCALDY